ncbi:hypothetical protein PPYR_14427 [Photinus pyralis]|uniref:Peroxisomal biogenesis factor 3 n=1 Tax=Photinus pyralis TaxID=7054 RepID=A0A1Y1JYL7_PHOPY|nr:peroxisomal biogenesis factor 3 [Photinus pyralis]KAB0792468.1 hypothetical protein PPYR_14427 [Photinus pyralis]
MGVFSKLGAFLNRHRNKFFVGGVLVSGSILLTRYAQHRLQEWQQNEAKEFFERTRKQQHYESTERTCNQTILNLINPLSESLMKATADIDEILAELRVNPANKLELWERLKVLVFTKVTCLVYVCSILTVMLRVQINMVGGYLYRDPASISADLQENYLSNCKDLLNSGLDRLVAFFGEKSKNVLEAIPLNRNLKIDELEKIFWAIQVSARESREDPVNKLRQYVFTENGIDDAVYKSVVQDTLDLLESEDTKLLMTSCIDRSFVTLCDQISEFYGPNMKDEFVHTSDVKVAMAKLIPIINGLFSKNALINSLIQQLIANEKLKVLGANVYEAFSFSNNNFV